MISTKLLPLHVNQTAYSHCRLLMARTRWDHGNMFEKGVVGANEC